MPDMSIVKDMLHDYAHRAVDAVSGAMKSATSSNPDKPVASSAPADDWVQRAKMKAQEARNKSIDDQIAANGG